MKRPNREIDRLLREHRPRPTDAAPLADRIIDALEHHPRAAPASAPAPAGPPRVPILLGFAAAAALALGAFVMLRPGPQASQPEPIPAARVARAMQHALRQAAPAGTWLEGVVAQEDPVQTEAARLRQDARALANLIGIDAIENLRTP